MPVGRQLVRVMVTLVSFAVAIALLVVGVPAVAGISWAQIADAFDALSWLVLAGLTVVWLTSLWLYTYVLTASLPGLSQPQAFLLNTAGSAVSNLLPFGGAAGMALTFAMARSWGHPHLAVTSSVLVTGVWNTLARLLLPALGLVALLASGTVSSAPLLAAAGAAVLALACAALLLGAVLGSGAAAVPVGRGVDLAARLLPAWLRPRPGRVGDFLVRLRRGSAELVGSRWPRLTLGMIGMLGMQALLFTCCLLISGGYMGWASAFAGFAVSRALTTVVITPGGLGIREIGTTSLLIALGAPPGPVVAGVLLFTLYDYALEIPLGALSCFAWMLTRHRHRQSAPVG